MNRFRASNFDEVFLEKSWEWLNDPEIKKLTSTPDFTKEEQKTWFEGLPYRNDYKVWGAYYGEVPVGAFGIKQIEDGSAFYFAYIGEKDYWGMGLGKEFILEAMKLSKDLGLKELKMYADKQNERSIIAHEKYGFVKREDLGDMYIMVLTL